MPEYLSPGVYVEEVPSAIKPITGVSTSTAAFVGVVPDTIIMVEENPNFDPSQKPYHDYSLTTKDGKPVTTQADVPDHDLAKFLDGQTYKVTVDGQQQDHKVDNSRFLPWVFPLAPDDPAIVAARQDLANKSQDGKGRRPKMPPAGADGKVDVKASAKALNDFRDAQAKLGSLLSRQQAGTMTPAREPVLCTTFGDFTRNFGSFSINPDQNKLAQAVFGFFHNGGSRCYVMRFADMPTLQDPMALAPLEAIDEISLVLAPGITDEVVRTNIVDHCENMSDRFAIVDSPELQPGPQPPSEADFEAYHASDYAALYFPWIQVFDTATKLTHLEDPDNPGQDPLSSGEIYVGPSGHVAGIYSRVDHERGVHKAPANEVVRGALDVEIQISKNLQDGLNPGGINCIRNINENITVWGARTIGGDLNADLKYVNVRRTLIFIRKSIDHGTQWVVFEPNDRALWAKIVRNVTAFLTGVWRDGALFGSTPQEAFYVKCDDETNPPADRDLGKVTTEIGVAIVRPAEFVIFRISQWAGPQGS